MGKTSEIKKLDGIFYCGSTALIEILKKSGLHRTSNRRAISEFVKEGMPYVMNGKEKQFPVGECLGWYVENKLDIVELRSLNIKADIAQKEKRTEKIDIEVGILKGEFVSIAEVSKSQSELITLLKNTQADYVNRLPNGELKTSMDEAFKESWNLIVDKLKQERDKDIDS